MAQIPSRQQILDWVADNPDQSTKRDLAKAFGLKGIERVSLKRLLREMEDEGILARSRRNYRDAGDLPAVTVLALIGPDDQGDLFARPLEWQGDGAEPRILFLPREGEPALGPGDRFLARLVAVDPGTESHDYEARLMRRISNAPDRIAGIFRKTAEGGRILPIDKGQNREWRVRRDATQDARDGELVEAEQAGPKDRAGLPFARIIKRLGDPSEPRAVSLIAIHQHGIPDVFPDEVLATAEALQPVPVSNRTDFRHLPFATIDPEDARDHDDAVAAMPDPDKPGCMLVWVAIADVAAYVRPDHVIDREARKRGNSTYFPDRVVPMLPEALSGNLCSLLEGQDRPAIVVRMRLDESGNMIDHRFYRAVIRSVAALTYQQAQRAADGSPDEKTAPLLDPVIRPLFAAHALLDKARARRAPLNLDLPERHIEITPGGRVKSVAFRERLTAHRLIEEMMVLANVAAAEALEARRQTLIYRVHEEPDPERIDALREVASASGFTLAKGQVLKTAHLNRLLAQAEGSDFDELININTLRAMTQAYYDPANLGHFGLALRSYAHFTSPIRRYADLMVHRALITAHRWGKDGLTAEDTDALADIAKHISDTERRSMAAERDTTDRYLAAFLSDRVGTELTGRINGVTRFGAFVKLDETGADGLIPIRAIGNEFFHFDPDAQTLQGADSGFEIGMGQRVTVRLAEAEPLTGGLTLDLLEVEGDAVAQAPRRAGRRKPVNRRKSVRHSRSKAASATKRNRLRRSRSRKS